MIANELIFKKTCKHGDFCPAEQQIIGNKPAANES